MPLGFPLGIGVGEGCQAAGRPCIVTQERILQSRPERRQPLGGSGCGAPGSKLGQGSDRFTRTRPRPDCLQTLRKRRSCPPWPWGLGHKSTFVRACSLTCEMRGQTETSGTFLALQVVSWWLNLQDTFPEGKGLRWYWVLLLSPFLWPVRPTPEKVASDCVLSA